MVGDFDGNHIERLASRYFGQMAKRSSTSRPYPQAHFPKEQFFQVTVASSIDKALVRYGWLTDDHRDIRRTRRLHVLAAIFEERLRQTIREELGKSYSPSAYSIASRIYPGYGVLYAEVTVDNESTEIAGKTVEDIAHSLIMHPVEDEELARAREPIITSLKDTFRTNGYWLYSVLSLSSRNEEKLKWPLTLIQDYRSIDSGEINELVKLYVRDDRRASACIKSVRSDGTASN